MPAKHLELDEAMAISETAFLPCRATVVADHNDASFSIRVEDDANRPLLSIAHVARSQYSDPLHLAGLIEQARLQLSKDKVQLAAWSMPMQPGITNGSDR